MPQNATIASMGSSHPVRQLESLARQIALPAEFEPQRFPSFPALERTALMSFTQPTSYTMTTAMAGQAMVTRQAAYPLWLSRAPDDNKFLYMAAYDVMYPTDLVANTVSELAIQPQLYYALAGTRSATAALPGTSWAAQSGPNVLQAAVLGVDRGNGPSPFVYVPKGASVALVLSQDGVVFPANAGEATVTVETWFRPGEGGPCDKYDIPFVVGNKGAGVVLTPFSTNRWIRPIFASTLAATDPTAVRIIVVVSSGTLVYTGSAVTCGSLVATDAQTPTQYLLPAAYPTEFSTSTLPWSSTRVTAVGALFTNVTQVLNKGGTVLAGRINPMTLNPFLAAKADISGLHPAEKSYLALETGLYTYCPPSTDLVDFIDYSITTSSSSNQWPIYRLDNTALVNIAFFEMAQTESLAVSTSWHLEFRTSSALFQVGISGLTLESLHQSQLALMKVGFFFENPNHIAILGAVVNAVRTYAKPFMGAVRGAIKGWNNPNPPKKRPKRPVKTNRSPPTVIRPKAGPSKPPTTTGTRSGISGPPKLRSGLDMYLNRRR